MESFTLDLHLKVMIIWLSLGNSTRRTSSTSISENKTKLSVPTLDQNYRFLMNIMKTSKKLSRDTSLHVIDPSEKFFSIQNSWNALEMMILRKHWSKRSKKTAPEFHTDSLSQRSIPNMSSWATFQRKTWSVSSSKWSQEATSSITSTTTLSKTWSTGSSKSSGPEITNDMLERPNHHNR